MTAITINTVTTVWAREEGGVVKEILLENKGF